jgi:hypothetical protein
MRTDFYYTPEYCEKLRGIANAPNISDYVSRVVLRDDEFVEHVIEDSSDTEFARLKKSPIKDLLRRLEIVRDFDKAKGNTDSRGDNRLAWIGMLLLPIGIALRLTKTSLELFVPLQ